MAAAASDERPYGRSKLGSGSEFGDIDGRELGEFEFADESGYPDIPPIVERRGMPCQDQGTAVRGPLQRVEEEPEHGRKFGAAVMEVVEDEERIGTGKVSGERSCT